MTVGRFFGKTGRGLARTWGFCARLRAREPYYYNPGYYPYGYYGYYPPAPAYYPPARRCWSPYYQYYYAC
jgi:hypothetical protein